MDVLGTLNLIGGNKERLTDRGTGCATFSFIVAANFNSSLIFKRVEWSIGGFIDLQAVIEIIITKIKHFFI